jgi:hypothetical protein
MDRIEGDKIILFDPHQSGAQVLKKVEIITADGEKRTYEIKRTANGKYLFN